MLSELAPRQVSRSRLLATNLSASATIASVRQFFSAAGQVLEVEFVAERGHNLRPSSAYVTMATFQEAEAAVDKLHSRLLHDRNVMVSLVLGRDGEQDRPRRAKPIAPGVSISQQYRERRGMVYELNCAGVPLTLRFFFQEEESNRRRVEASARDCVAEASGATVQLALLSLGETWPRLVDPPAPEIDWTEVAAALKTVRAV